MVAEVLAGVSAFKAMFDMAKGLKDINDATIRNGAVIELQEQILTAQAAQSDLIERIRELEKEVASFEQWDAKEQEYELKKVARGAVAYMLKPEGRGTKPPHWVCTHCFQNRKISIMQPLADMGGYLIHKCPGCANTFRNRGEEPVWID